MTPAKPQQMSGPKDDADDLIAELTKLMAVDTKPGGASNPAPTIRIPGQPAPGPATTVRIPGVAAPANNDILSNFRPAPPVQPTQQPSAGSAWQDRLGSRPAPSQDPLAAFDAATAPRSVQQGGQAWRPAIAPNDIDAGPAAPRNANFDFDFGFNRDTPPKPAAQAPATQAAPVAPVPVARQPAPPIASAPSPASWNAPEASPAPAAPVAMPTGRDPIADLIAAELSAEMDGRGTAPPSQPAAPAPVPVYVANPAPPAVARSVPEQPRVVHEAPRQAPPPAPQPAARTAPYAPRPVPEDDAFSTAPVFGLGGKPTNEVAPPKARPDPMDEIESLIGEAVRVELNMPAPQAPRLEAPRVAAQPAVPPLGQMGPRRTTGLREAEVAPRSADDAILAATAAGAGSVGRVDSAYADGRATQGRKPKKQARAESGDARTSTGGGLLSRLAVPVLGVLFIALIGGGLYYVLALNHSDGGKPPVLTVDSSVPVKTTPTKPDTDDSQRSVVMDQLGGAPAAPSSETLVSRDQSTPTDAAPPTSVPAVTAPAADASANGDNGLANRKVRTVTVRPDGSIVSNDDSVAGGEKLPVDRPNVPTVPGASAPSDATAPTADAAPAAQPATAAVATAPEAAPAATAPDATDATSANAPVPLPPPSRTRTVQTQTITGNGSISSKPTSPVNAVVKPNASKPMDLIGDLAAQADDTTTAAPKPQANVGSDSVASVNAVTSAAGHVQLSSQTSQAAAQSSAARLQQRYGSLWGGAKLQVVKVDLGSRGVFYRVMLPTSSAEDANSICSSIKGSGGDCVANR